MAVDALIFDDAPYFVGFLQAILEDLGLTVKFFNDGNGALDHIRREGPRVVFLDVMMPGADGLSICKEIKADPRLSGMKVVIVSGKSFMDDKARATWASADLYVEKPFNVDEFSENVKRLLTGVRRREGQAPAPAAKPAPPRPEAAPLEEKSSARGPWRIRFWGKDKSSNCMSFVDRDRLIVVDAGTGMEALTLEGVEPGVKDVWLLLTHYHQDHVAALEHARRWIQAGLRFHVVGPAETESILARVVERALPSVPVDVRPLWEGAFDGLPGLQVKALYTMHPGACFAYSFEAPGRSAIFAPDSEIPPDGGSGAADNTEKLASFALGADLLVHDARYSDDDYPGFAGRGHSCPRAALELALRAGVRTLVLCHVDAKYSAEERARALAAIRARGDPDMTLGACLLAESGLEIEL